MPPPWPDWLSELARYLGEHRELATWFVVVSIVMFIAGILVVNALVVRMPADYFCRHAKPTERRHPVVHVLAVIGRNLLGIVLLLGGIAMLIGPGQGLLTILLAIGLLDFPGKRSVELGLVRRGPIRRAINWLRHRAGRPPLVLPPRPGVTSA